MTGPAGTTPPRTAPTTSVEAPFVHFGREICGDLQGSLRREWLVTNGLGSYASGTVAGVDTRRYHGLLVAALQPPVERTVLVAGSVDHATYAGRKYQLSTHEYEHAIDPNGYANVESFSLAGSVPVWTYALGDALLERRVWMAFGAHTTYVTYRMVRGSSPVDIEVTPLTTNRGFHSLTRAGDPPEVTPLARGAAIRAYDGAPTLKIASSSGEFRPPASGSGGWWWNFFHREEAARGLDRAADLYAPGSFVATVAPGETLTFAYTIEDAPSLDGEGALLAELDRQRGLIKRAGAQNADPVVRQLVLAADQFIVERPPYGKSIIAGYHWFNDWGRDTMIALPGLTLAAGRSEDAASILRGFATFVSEGLLPNNFPDSSGAVPGYNTADASLWYFVAVHRYVEATGDRTLARDLLPVLRDIADWHIRGTKYGIGVDPADGLLRAGEPGVQLTWMDAKVGDWVVTPRIGKPVEINALWYNALRILADLCKAEGDTAAATYSSAADRALGAFRSRFARTDGMGLYDVVDGPDGDDASVRPNQTFAVSLPYPLVEGPTAKIVVDAVARELLVTCGLRSLSAGDPAYCPTYGGDVRSRDGAYHQGTAWTWLIGPFVEAHYRVYGDAALAMSFLQPFADHLRDAGLGSVSEILDAGAPHTPRGCIAQAWGVAEVLRVWRLLAARSG